MNEKLTSSIETEEQSYKIVDIYDKFAKTEDGAEMAGKLRWDRYRPDNVSKEEWEKIFGADVNNLKHLKLTYGLTRAFISYSEALELTEDEKEDLLLAAIIHDYAEAVVGDISYEHKTEDDETAEYEALKRQLRNLYGNDQELLDRAVRVLDTVIRDRNTRLGMVFNAIERVGYVRTGLKAWDHSKTTPDDFRINLEWMANNSFIFQIKKLIEYSKKYLAVKKFLLQNQDRISDAFDNISDESFEKYDEENEKKIEAGEETGKSGAGYKAEFEQVKKAWESFLAE